MKKEKHGAGDVQQAEAMLDAFSSVGVNFFDITHTNIDEEKRGFRPKQTIEQATSSMPHLIPASARRCNNVIIRPHQPPAVLLIQLDDLEAAMLERVRSAAFLIVATSPGSFQAWIAVQASGVADRKDFARRVRKATGADPSASGASRIAGTGNYKRKYEPDFPTVRIDAAAPDRVVAPDELEALGLVAPPERAPTAPAGRETGRAGGKARRWPSYRYCVEHAPKAHGADRADISRADFTWCMTAIDWGFSVDETAARLMEESFKAQENGPDYAQETARNAAAAVDRRYGRAAADPAP